VAWQLIDTAQLADGVLELYAQDNVFMIRANGLELMNGLGHQSETILGRMAVEVARVSHPNILIGGLGLGYTLAAAARALGGTGSITVAELSPSVIAWFDKYVARSVLPSLPPNLNIVAADIGDLIRTETEARYDVIVLDVDNGPEALVSPQNERLYSPEGLRAFAARLSPDGVILLWSGFESREFAALAEAEGFSVTCMPLTSVGRADLLHYAYVLTRHSAY
jgi:spermidine synthase